VSYPVRLAYFRVSTGDQSIDAQRHALGGEFDREFADEGVSGGVMAADRPGFAKLLGTIRAGDLVHVYAVDRLGRDAIDVQATVKRLVDLGVTIDIHGIGAISGDAAKLTLAIFAQLAEMERGRIKNRTSAGREAARAALAATGKTHKGKLSLGRPKAHNGDKVTAWRKAHAASISATATHFGISASTVKRACAECASSAAG
jgi:putative DNA-invertase from lambdoid prophage Rac